MSDPIGLWRGKPISEMDRDGLLEVIKDMSARAELERSWQEQETRNSTDQLSRDEYDATVMGALVDAWKRCTNDSP